MATNNLICKASRFFQRNNNDTSPLSDVQAQHTVQSIPKNSDPFPDTPGILLPTSPPRDIPRNILAFRTITKLLSHIQQEQAFKVSWNKSLPEKKEELELSTAFATIAVIEHEVIAVVTKHTVERIEVICTPQTRIQDTSINDLSTNQGKWFLRALHFFITKNPRQNDPPPAILPIRGPTISYVANAGTLPGTDLDNDEILKTWVDEHW